MRQEKKTGRKFYITTAIDYVNSKPHLGTAYEKIVADVIARYHRLLGDDTFFLMGNDEHSLNVAAKAKELGLDVLEYCDQMEEEFRRVWERLNISFDDFIRTTEKRHEETVRDVLSRVYEKGDIYQGTYEGWYCVSCEAFYRDKDLIDGLCPLHQKKPVWISEKNYFFSLSKYEKPLLKLIEEENPDFIRPEIRKNEILSLIHSGLEDVSLSRSSTHWGIPLPFDPNNVVYVWFDALINYLSGVGYATDKERFERYWPADLHLIGKDITRFHCVIWPAILMSAGIELPKSVFAHGFITISGERMSKTLGTALDPLELADKYHADAVRYFLIREIPLDRDGDFSIERFRERFNAELANDYGNLLSRTITMIEKYNQGRIIPPKKDDDEKLKAKAVEVIERYRKRMDALELEEGIKAIWELLRAANLYIDREKPWELAKQQARRERLTAVLYNLAESLRKISILLYPVMPEKTSEALAQLGLAKPADELSIKEVEEWGTIPADTRVRKGGHLFPRLS